MSKRAGLALLSVAVLACSDNPFSRPLTFVDGSDFPAGLRGVVSPRAGYLGGNKVSYFLFGPAPARLAEVIEIRGAGGEALPACQGPGRSAGHLQDATLDHCQGRILSVLPDSPDQSPFSRVLEARLPAAAQAGDVRGRSDLARLGVTPVTTSVVLALAIVDPDTTLSDPTGKLTRLVGFYGGLGVVYLELPGPVPVDASGEVIPMDLLVPEGAEPGAGGDVLPARAGAEGYSPLCRVVRFRVPMGFQPGDLTAADQIPESDRTVEGTLLHCAIP